MSLLVIGSFALDDIESPSGQAKGVLGGAASYFSLAASYFTQVSAVGVVGEDFPEAHLALLRDRGIDLAGVYTAPGKTFRWGGRYAQSLNDRDTLFTELGVFEGFEPTLTEEQRDAEFVFLANIHPKIQLDVLSQVRSPRFSAMDTMNFWIDGAPDDLAKTIERVTCLVINDEEARLLTGEHNLTRAVAAIRERGPRIVIIKRGEHGALLFDGDDFFAAPAFPLAEVQDPTGAGDTFAGGFMGSLAREGFVGPETLRRAAIFGSTLASFCVEKFSVDRLRTLEMAEVYERYARFRSLTQF